MKISIKQLLSAGLLGIATASSPALAAPDEKLRAATEQAQPALIATLRDMVMIESDRKSTRLNSSHIQKSRMPSSA